MKRYKFIGDGAGVPGLAHEISQAEIEQMNETQLNEWHQALASGVYIEITEVGGTPPKKNKSKKSALADKGE